MLRYKFIVHTVECKISYFGFCLFPSSCGFSKEKHVCSEISQGCCAVRPSYLWFISQMGSLLLLLSPSVCSLSFDYSSPPLALVPSPLLFSTIFNLCFYSLYTLLALLSYLICFFLATLLNLSWIFPSFLFYLLALPCTVKRVSSLDPSGNKQYPFWKMYLESGYKIPFPPTICPCYWASGREYLKR